MYPNTLCYKIILKPSPEITSYEKASEICKAVGAKMGRVQDVNENSFFLRSWEVATSTYSGQKHGHVLFGARDTSVPFNLFPHRFKWEFDNIIMTWSNWGPNEPTRIVYAVAAQTQKVLIYKPNSTVVDSEIELSLYDRVVRIADVPAPRLPLFVNLLEAHAPVGVTITVKEHQKADEDYRYTPDILLKQKQEELKALDDPNVRRNLGWE